MPSNATTDPTMPGRYVLYAVELAKRWRVTPRELLEGVDLDLESLSDPRTRVPVASIVAVLERGRALTGERAFGFYLGLQMRVSAHGDLGTAVVSAPTMRAGIELAIRFMPVVTTALSMRLEVVGKDAALIVDEHADFGRERDTVLLAALIGIWQIGLALTGHDLGGHADLALPEPDYFPHLLLLGPSIRCNQPVNRLFFDASMLDLPYRMADPVALQLARDECERLLETRDSGADVTTRVRSLVTHIKGRDLTLEHVSEALHMSARTLKRQLAAEGSSFSSIVEKERRARAVFLLGSPGVSLTDVATRLGYANLANFTRAFFRWTGKTPTAYRDSVTRAQGR